jgi:hypothetical protein
MSQFGAIAAAHPVSYSTLLRYLDKCANEAPKPQPWNLHLCYRLSKLVLQEELRRLIHWNINPSLEFICGFTQHILRQSFDPSTNLDAEPLTMGKNWAATEAVSNGLVCFYRGAKVDGIRQVSSSVSWDILLRITIVTAQTI